MKQYVYGNKEQAAAFLKEKDDEIGHLQGVIEGQAREVERLQGVIEQAREVIDFQREIDRLHAEIQRLQGIIERQAREVEARRQLTIGDRLEIERCHAEIDRLRKASAQG